MSYTRGEWKVVGFLGEHDEMGAIIKADNKTIAHTVGGLRYHSKPEEWGEYHANAQLIAAAPELYEACKGFTTILEEFNNMLLTHKSDKDIVARLDYLLDTYGAIAEQATAKAEGK